MQLVNHDECAVCDGVGWVTQKTCPSCYGKGDFEHHEHTYECQMCESLGYVQSIAAAPSEANTHCDHCSGTGFSFSKGGENITLFRGAWFQKAYLAALSRLPGIAFGVKPTAPYDPNQPALFVFDGGEGALMPCRAPVDHEAQACPSTTQEPTMPQTQASTLHTVGTHLPEHGGTLGAIVARADGTLYGLIVADAAHDVTGQWGKYGAEVPGARGTHGAASTFAMAEAGSKIAVDVLALRIAAHTDWYIPSRLELLSVYEQAPQLFDKNELYWSSSQYSRSHAWCQYVECGGSYASLKDDELRARPVRSIQLQPFTPSTLPGTPAPADDIGEADPREFLGTTQPAPVAA